MTLAQNQERLRKWGFLSDKSAGYGPNTEAAYTKALDALEKFLPLGPAVAGPVNTLTLRGLAEVISHEAIILEMYKDSVGVNTWGPGITSASGHNVERYKDNPSTLERALEVFLWLVNTKYFPEVLAAFKGYNLSEAEAAAALSFHWNTGAIGKATWVKLVKEGKFTEARASIMEWNKPAEIKERRGKERDLFFDHKWSGDGNTLTYQVNKPSYSPKWSSAKRIPIMDALQKVMEASK